MISATWVGVYAPSTCILARSLNLEGERSNHKPSAVRESPVGEEGSSSSPLPATYQQSSQPMALGQYLLSTFSVSPTCG